MVSGASKHVLITFARSFLTLNLARLMAAGGHRVTVVDCVPIAVSRYSNAVSAFHRVPAPKFEPQEYCRELAAIVEAEKVDMVIPIHEETDILAMMAGLFPETCELFLSPFELEDTLHNKLSYQRALDEHGFSTLKFAELSSPDDVAALDFTTPFAVKQAYSRGSQEVYKVYPGDDLSHLAFDPTNPWIAQEWLEGDRYCTYSVCRDGEVYAHATYPVSYAIDGKSCLTFEQVDHDGILEWTKKFAKAVNFTGHMGLDFIDHPDRGLYTIECNPRGTSGIMMFTRDCGVHRAFFGENSEIVFPPAGRTTMIGAGMAIFGWKKDSYPDNTFGKFWKQFREADDVIVDPLDRKPAVMMPLAYASIARQGHRYGVGLAEAFMHDHEWDGIRIT
ncbi:ATP-grasp domain-containing protein [Gordonia zhaorongruii]|uniref:ATP-grasp domain-containing protein n=1 Tax=Gordonia zhaorongruii TaxID=2597659 RepID=UPI001F28AB34|nr:ATP-grasp domain-containing protein [Gordonia zhaorongruii]